MGEGESIDGIIIVVLSLAQLYIINRTNHAASSPRREVSSSTQKERKNIPDIVASPNENHRRRLPSLNSVVTTGRNQWHHPLSFGSHNKKMINNKQTIIKYDRFASERNIYGLFRIVNYSRAS